MKGACFGENDIKDFSVEKRRHENSEGTGLEAVVSRQTALRVQAWLLLATCWVTEV